VAPAQPPVNTDQTAQRNTALPDPNGRGTWRSIGIGTASLLLAALVIVAVWVLAHPLAMAVLAVAIAAALAPLVSWLSRRMPRTLAVLLIYLALLALLVGAGWLIVPAMVDQAMAIGERLPDVAARLEEWAAGWGLLDDIAIFDTLASQLASAAGWVLSVPLALLASLFDIFLILFVSTYALIESPRLSRFVLSLFPESQRHRANTVLNEMLQAMGGYVRGVALGGLAVGFITYIGLSIIGVQYALVLSLFAGLMEFAPVIGPIIAAMPMLAIALLASPAQFLAVLVFVIVLQQIESALLTPNIMKSQTEVSPLLVILALLAGHTVGGLMGALVAIPLAAAGRVLVTRVIAPAVRRWTGAEPMLESRTKHEGLPDEDG
jgi:putative heme transporter